MRTRPRTLLPALLVLALALSLMPAGASAGPNESIGVSGHWVIEIRDPDDTLVTRTEFHNEFNGQITLTNIVTSGNAPGPFSIFMDCNSNCCPGVGGGGFLQQCRITESRSPAPSPPVFKNLTVTRNGGSFELRGFAVAASTSAIIGVETRLHVCSASTAPASCNPTQGAGNALTTTALPSPIPVVAGQQILLTVTIGFANATAPSPATSPAAPAQR
jgi:hypothetical protein